ncbi:MAG TPA: hypothetical protein VJ917_06825 [Saprospiraceae bacterium]|nr:hypothetical protein [Saprospiraceae bacterium]
MILKISLYSIFFFALSCLLISCIEDCECERPPDEFYVKYEISSSTIYRGREMEIEIKDEDGMDLDFTIEQGQDWTLTIGPVPKGFEATLYAVATSDTADRLTLNARIYIGKNGDPFALKARNESDETRDSVYLAHVVE